MKNLELVDSAKISKLKIKMRKNMTKAFGSHFKSIPRKIELVSNPPTSYTRCPTPVNNFIEYSFPVTPQEIYSWKINVSSKTEENPDKLKGDPWMDNIVQRIE